MNYFSQTEFAYVKVSEIMENCSQCHKLLRILQKSSFKGRKGFSTEAREPVWNCLSPTLHRFTNSLTVNNLSEPLCVSHLQCRRFKLDSTLLSEGGFHYQNLLLVLVSFNLVDVKIRVSTQLISPTLDRTFLLCLKLIYSQTWHPEYLKDCFFKRMSTKIIHVNIFPVVITRKMT